MLTISDFPVRDTCTDSLFSSDCPFQGEIPLKLYLRFFWLLITQSFKSRCQVSGPVVTRMRVYPNDLDINGHVNNGVYLTYADLGRLDMMLRSDVLWPIVRKGWNPVVLAETVRFYKSLKLFQRFEMTTRVLGWDEKNFFLEQRFTRGDTLYALVIINARFLIRGGGSVSTEKLLAVLGIEESSPAVPDWVEQWRVATETCDVLNRG